MKIFQLAIATLTITGFGYAAADPVNPANVTTFQSGTPAFAGEVNSTLQALIVAIDDNAARIAAVETEQSRLVPASVEGSTYCVYDLSAGVGASDPDPVTGDGNWMGASAGAAIFEVTFTAGQVTLTSIADSFYEALGPSNRLLDSSDPLGSESATWTQVGHVVTITFPDLIQDTLLITPDSNVIILSLAEFDRASDNSGDWFGADLAVGVRAPSCN